MSAGSMPGADAPSDVTARAHDLTCVNSLFEQPWWLEAVAPGRWKAPVVRVGERVVARLPYVESRMCGLSFITQPPLTAALGPWFAPRPPGEARRLELEKKWMTNLIAQLPRFDLFSQNLSPAITNWLPFYWAGFKATVRYTYRLADLSDLDVVWKNLHEKTRSEIRKGSRELSVRTDLGLQEFLRLNALTFDRRGLKPSYSEELVERIDRSCVARDARATIFAIDAQGRAIAAAYVVWDRETAYYLMGGRDDSIAPNGATSFVLWEAIKLVSTRAKSFDFEGSMIESIERFFRRFGGHQTPYFHVTKATARAQPILAARRVRGVVRRNPLPNLRQRRR